MNPPPMLKARTRPNAPVGGRVESVGAFLDELRKIGFVTGRHSHVRPWFRGHSCQGWCLEPGVYREGFAQLDNNEDARLRKEQHLIQDFRVLSAGLGGRAVPDVDLYFLAQHYRMPTRLLDWTLNPLAALYFAAENDHHMEGEIFLLDAYQFRDSQNQTLDGIATSRRPEFTSNIEVIASWKKFSEFGPNIIPVRPDHIDQRISAQSSCFTFHTPSSRSLDIQLNPTLRYFTVPRGHKSGIIESLSLIGVNKFSVFGDLESLAKVLISAYERS